ncbi:hypothetical protein M427DRAFT_173118 [Gonapodya prolifera JEL478]|uniref:Bola-like protein n=1 Tax=Gonapodya prolifera (strain JEL478) TaxID=1344416 RepID=A0A139B0E1_GONPJ|nr:hypothetical protein M427DRAFT_173118 [Gonapodya prolifera JEL478]|eukprot:KXS22461.1 hypothetical protein M427DRAFT_173118 [Gonapodya prolifera JEL478]
MSFKRFIPSYHGASTLTRSLSIRSSHPPRLPFRSFANDASSQPSPPADPNYTSGERDVHLLLAAHQPLQPISKLVVSDTSGGCGSMYAIEIASGAFNGLGLLKQHRLVTDALQETMKAQGWHGVTVKTQKA